MTPTLTTVVSTIASRTEPALVWIDQFGRLELTGRVFANWIYKSAGLLRDSGAELFVVCAPAHWREWACVLAACGTGVPVYVSAEVAPTDEPLTPDVATWVGMVQSDRPTQPFALASELWVHDPAPLALTTQVGDDDIDFLSTVRAYPDITLLEDHPVSYRMGTHEVVAEFTAPLAASGRVPANLAVTSVPATGEALADVCYALATGLVTVDLTTCPPPPAGECTQGDV